MSLELLSHGGVIYLGQRGLQWLRRQAGGCSIFQSFYSPFCPPSCNSSLTHSTQRPISVTPWSAVELRGSKACDPVGGMALAIGRRELVALDGSNTFSPSLQPSPGLCFCNLLFQVDPTKKDHF